MTTASDSVTSFLEAAVWHGSLDHAEATLLIERGAPVNALDGKDEVP